MWKAERFSWWMIAVLHRLAGGADFTTRLQRAELDDLVGSDAALAENQLRLPY